jgi:hypothetical protein
VSRTLPVGVVLEAGAGLGQCLSNGTLLPKPAVRHRRPPEAASSAPCHRGIAPRAQRMPCRQGSRSVTREYLQHEAPCALACVPAYAAATHAGRVRQQQLRAAGPAVRAQGRRVVPQPGGGRWRLHHPGRAAHREPAAAPIVLLEPEGASPCPCIVFKSPLPGYTRGATLRRRLTVTRASAHSPSAHSPARPQLPDSAPCSLTGAQRYMFFLQAGQGWAGTQHSAGRGLHCHSAACSASARALALGSGGTTAYRLRAHVPHSLTSLRPASPETGPARRLPRLLLRLLRKPTRRAVPSLHIRPAAIVIL